MYIYIYIYVEMLQKEFKTTNSQLYISQNHKKNELSVRQITDILLLGACLSIKSLCPKHFTSLLGFRVQVE